jgi:phage baseplate assembly protein W
VDNYINILFETNVRAFTPAGSDMMRKKIGSHLFQS